jgi:hypothetical protein
MKRYILLFALFFSIKSFSQTYQLTNSNDTVNRTDKNKLKQGKWIIRVTDNMGEPGYQEEGLYKNGEKEGSWHVYNLMGDPIGDEKYKYGQKNGIQQYFDKAGSLIREESWKAFTPDDAFDTIQVPNWKKDPTGNTMKTVIVKQEVNCMKNGTFKFYDDNGRLVRSEIYKMDHIMESTNLIYDLDRETGKIKSSKEIQKYDYDTGKVVAQAGYQKPKTPPAKLKQMVDFEKTKKGKKKKYVDGSTGNP